MGTEAEAKWFFNFEDAVTPIAEQMGFFQIGRVRSAGRWELAFYAAPGMHLGEVLDAAGPIVNEREIGLSGMDDPEWGYLFGYMAPDAERWQWILNNKVVVQLADAGDNLDEPRPVDHTARFPTESDRVAFIAAVEQQGFEITSTSAEDGGWFASIQREDSARIGQIHPVVMEIVELAQSFGGTYDGWGCPIAV